MDSRSKSASIELLPEHREPESVDEEQGWFRHYRKLEALGAGGWAEVFEAIDPGGVHVALKISKTGDEELRRFRREVEMLSKLKHQNVVELLDSGADWYVMPLAEGNLTKLAPELSDEERIEMVEHIAAGLGAAHQAGLTHRDVTPNNMLRVRSGDRTYWTISDFGLVRRPVGQTSAVATNGRLGTPGFYAPEVTIFGAHKVDHRADIYGLGRTIEFMTTAKWPVHQEPIPVPAIWEPLVKKMTCHPVAERFQQMDEVRAQLPGVAARLKAQRRAQFVEVHLVPSEHLLPQETIVLRAILSITTDVFTEQELRNGTKKSYPRRVLSVGLLGLRQRGFIEEATNDHGERWGERMSSSGRQWVLDHHAELEQEPSPEPEPQEGPPPAGGEDAPF